MVLMDAPDMVRTQMNFKRLSLTDIKSHEGSWWENSSWGRKLIVQKRRVALNDFDRFKIMLAKIKRGGLIRKELPKLMKEAS